MSSLRGFAGNQVGKALSGDLPESIRAAQSGSSVEEKGWTVGGGLGLDSMAVNLAFVAMSKVTNKAIGWGGSTLKNAGLLYAAQGGKLRRGIFIWDEPDTGKPARFTFPMNPSAISEELSPNWAETQVPGQNRPMYQFINGGPREVSFTLNFFYQDRRREVIRNQIAALKGLTQRRYTGKLMGAYEGPPAIYFFFGDYFMGERFIVSKISVKAFDLFDPARLLPMRADVEISLLECWDTTAVKRVSG
jgi:hypothetical protein